MKKILFLLSIGVMLIAAGCGSQESAADGQRLFIGDDIAITKTEYGLVQGYILDDVYTYLSIPYGAPTSGANRFMPPQEPQKYS